MRDRPESALTQQDHVVEEEPFVLARALVRRDWLLLVLVCLILILQIWQMVEEKDDPLNTIFPEKEQGQSPGKASEAKDGVADSGRGTTSVVVTVDKDAEHQDDKDRERNN